jgi:hypothetical protein
MEQRKSQKELINKLVTDGKISQDKADEIFFAPMWSLSARELVTYLGSLIIAVGFLRLLAFAFEDASKWSVMTAAYVLALVLAISAWKLSGHSGVRGRLSEVLELGAVTAALLASIVPLDAVELKSQIIGMILAALATGWGVCRLTQSSFSGTTALSAGLPGFAISLGALIDDNDARYVSVLLVIAGAFLIWVAIQQLGFPQMASTAGSLSVVIGSIALGSSFNNNTTWFPILAGAVLFGVGATQIAPESLVSGALCVIVGIVMTVTEFVDSELIQSLVIIGSGVVVLLVLGAQMRRRTTKSGPEIQVV